MVMEGIQEDMGDGSMICTNHPYKNSTPGGICAFCLQEKLGKLVSSSFPSLVFPSSSSSSTPSFRSDLPVQTNTQTTDCNKLNHCDTMRKSRMPFLLPHKKEKDGSSVGIASNVGIAMMRSKSSTTPRNMLDENHNSQLRKRFWSFLYYSSTAKKTVKEMRFPSSSVNDSMVSSGEKKKEEVVENESVDEAASDRKVSRSRSVGCGSRSFSGDFFERISSGFGDCTLRRVESQREGKSSVKCGGIFSGFMITSSSSSSSSSSHWVSSEDNSHNISGKSATQLVHGRSNKSWGIWAFASPMRGFSKTSSSKNATPNLAAIPSLLIARS